MIGECGNDVYTIVPVIQQHLHLCLVNLTVVVSVVDNGQYFNL